MDAQLDRSSRRVIGVLVEKELTTPNQYPLSIHALTAGCNQKSSRIPVMHLRDFEVEGVLRALYVNKWVTNVSQPGGRVLKWKHRFAERLGLEPPELAVMCELLLREAQQPGELRSHVSRLVPVADMAALEQILGVLEQKGFITNLPPAPGQRTRRWNHTLHPENENATADTLSELPSAPAAQGTAPPANPVATDPMAAVLSRLEALEIRIAKLEDQQSTGDSADS